MASRNVFFFFELLFWPIVGVLSIGLMTRFLHLTPEQASFVLIGTIALSVVNVCQLEVAYAVLLDVWSKSLKHQFLAPIGIRHLTLGSWLVGMARGGALFLLLAVLGWWAFDFRVLAPGWLPVAVFVLGCFLNAWIVGVFVCALITLFGNRAEAFAWASVNLVLVLAGLYYPVSVLPEPVATLAAGIPPLWGPMERLAGPAYPIACPAGDNLMLHVAIHRAPAGSVIVCAAGDSNWAMAGGNVCAYAQQRGIAGFVVDGLIRDLAETRERRFRVFARGVILIPGVRKTAGLIDVPVVCGGVTVAPGDVVVADEEGIVVLPKGQAEAILAQAASRADKDAKTTLADWVKAHKARIDELTRSLGI